MKKISIPIVIVSAFILGMIVFSIGWGKQAYKPTRFFNRSGEVHQQMRVFLDSFVCTTGNGMTIDISAAGFTTVKGVVASAEKNTSSATSCPKVEVKSQSTTSVVLNIYEGNATTVNILGSLVLLGASESFVSSPSTVTVHVMAVGY